jgi:tetratricopeptide (TPR) repeat protein
MRCLSEGETLLQSKQYRPAADSFEIAVFGLAAWKEQQARARAGLGLAFYFLNDRLRSEEALKAAVAAIGAERLTALPLPEQVKADLLRLLRFFKLNAPLPPPGPSSERGPSPSTAPADTKALEEAILKEPRRSELYLELGRARLAAGDARAARTVYERLLRENPSAVRGYLELGKIAYLERRFRDAEKEIERFLELAPDQNLEAALLVEARAYLCLAAFLRGDARKSERVLRQSPEPLTEDAIRALGLREEDLDRLLRILKTPAK